MSCWRRLRDLQAARARARRHLALLGRMGAAGRIRRDRAAPDSTAAGAERGGAETGPDGPGPAGHQAPIATDAERTPPRLTISPARRHDGRLAGAALDAVPQALRRQVPRIAARRAWRRIQPPPAVARAAGRTARRAARPAHPQRGPRRRC